MENKKKSLLHKIFIDDTYESNSRNQFTRIFALLVYILAFCILAIGFGSGIYYISQEFKGIYVFGIIFTGLMSVMMLRMIINSVIEIYRKFKKK